MTPAAHHMTDNNTKLSVLYLNINGTSKDKKRNNIFKNVINKNIDIILL